MSDIRQRLYDFITDGTTTEQYQDLATDAYNEIVALQSDVEMYKQMAIKAIDKAQDEAVAAARNEALEEAEQAVEKLDTMHEIYQAAVTDAMLAIRRLKEQGDG